MKNEKLKKKKVRNKRLSRRHGAAFGCLHGGHGDFTIDIPLRSPRSPRLCVRSFAAYGIYDDTI